MRVLVCTVDFDPCPPGNVSSIALNEAVDFAALGITPDQILYVCSWGVGVVLSLWAIGYAVGAGVAMIKKL
ncbi:MAG: hypothetical protein HYX43_17060 [Burkholderiales bacterium]|nr:hypothetical protein [Burkholderiales bacterium]